MRSGTPEVLVHVGKLPRSLPPFDESADDAREANNVQPGAVHHTIVDVPPEGSELDVLNAAASLIAAADSPTIAQDAATPKGARERSRSPQATTTNMSATESIRKPTATPFRKGMAR